MTTPAQYIDLDVDTPGLLQRLGEASVSNAFNRDPRPLEVTANSVVINQQVPQAAVAVGNRNVCFVCNLYGHYGSNCRFGVVDPTTFKISGVSTAVMVDRLVSLIAYRRGDGLALLAKLASSNPSMQATWDEVRRRADAPPEPRLQDLIREEPQERLRAMQEAVFYEVGDFEVQPRRSQPAAPRPASPAPHAVMATPAQHQRQVIVESTVSRPSAAAVIRPSVAANRQLFPDTPAQVRVQTPVQLTQLRQASETSTCDSEPQPQQQQQQQQGRRTEPHQARATSLDKSALQKKLEEKMSECSRLRKAIKVAEQMQQEQKKFIALQQELAQKANEALLGIE